MTIKNDNNQLNIKDILNSERKNEEELKRIVLELVDNQKQMEEKYNILQKEIDLLKEYFYANTLHESKAEYCTPKDVTQLTLDLIKVNDGLKNINFSSYVLKNNLKQILEQQGINQTWVQSKTDIKKSTFNTIVNNINKKISLEDAYKISMVLGMSIEEIFPYVTGNIQKIKK